MSRDGCKPKSTSCRRVQLGCHHTITWCCTLRSPYLQRLKQRTEVFKVSWLCECAWCHWRYTSPLICRCHGLGSHDLSAACALLGSAYTRSACEEMDRSVAPAWCGYQLGVVCACLTVDESIVRCQVANHGLWMVNGNSLE